MFVYLPSPPPQPVYPAGAASPLSCHESTFHRATAARIGAVASSLARSARHRDTAVRRAGTVPSYCTSTDRVTVLYRHVV